MPTIAELNQRRAATSTHLQMLGMLNVPTDYAERLKQDAQYRLAQDAHYRAESEYQAALSAMTTDELIELAK